MTIDGQLAAAGLPPLPRTAWLAIDLDRLAGNLRAFREALPAGVRIEPAVKADAYGHGAVPVARTLEAAGADGLCVATWDEALELRAGGVRLPILVLFPVPPGFVFDAARHDVTMTLGDETLLGRSLEAWVARSGVRSGDGRTLRVQLELETGLGRGGVPLERLPAIVDAIRRTPGVELIGAWSHLGSPDDRTRSAAQSARFDEARDVLSADDGAVARAWHLAASGGLLADSARPYDVVRPGLAIYGIVAEGLAVAAGRRSLAGAIRPVMSLRAMPVRVADLPAGTAISYGSSFVTARRSRIATLPVGYGDGYQRARSNRAEALVRGQRVPLVGTIAMDAVMADVTDVAVPPVTVDDEFVLLGEQGDGTINAAELARAGTTISWEVLASMARRLPRVYYAAATPVHVRTLTEETGQWRGANS